VSLASQIVALATAVGVELKAVKAGTKPVYQVTLNGTTVNYDPSAYRRNDFTCGTAATQIIFANPVVYPIAGQCLPTITLLIRTPAGITPGVITWLNLTGSDSIPLPAASQVVAAQLEWVDETIGWLVIGVRA
jgi:hypothetical protein